MAFNTRSTLKSRYWRGFFNSIRYCHHCGGALTRRYVKAEKTRRHVCDRCLAITYLNPKVVAGLIPVMPDGRVVLLRRNIEPAFGQWTYPAGFMELGETVEQAAVRETLEEIGVGVGRTRFVGLYSYADAGVVTLVYTAAVKRGHVPCVTPEACEVRLFTRRQIPWKQLAFRSVTQALRDWNCQGRG
jgi:ADP-ribose pyrophosphatase YjhB (NUDIX family)